jgi:hypothetical protein
MDDLGFKFWLKLFGMFIVGAIVLFIFLIIFTKAVYAWGILGAFVGLAAIALFFAWIHDRREQRRAGV